jgi:hypothetical protein
VNHFGNLLNQFISLFIFIPLVAFIASLIWQNKQEKPIAQIVLFTKAFYLGAAIIYAILWVVNGGTAINKKLFTVYQTTILFLPSSFTTI